MYHNRSGRSTLAFNSIFTAAPAFSNIRTSRLLADGMKAQTSKVFLDACI